MDDFYDFEGAGNALNKIIQERLLKTDTSVTQLIEFETDEDIYSKVTTTISEHPRRTLLAVYDSPDKIGIEEAVLRIQGIVAQKDLPPILSKIKGHPGNIRQSVSLTGVGIDNFEIQGQCVRRVEELLARDFKEGEMDKWTTSNMYGYVSIDMGNRYFSAAKECSCLQALTMDNTIDPKGHLRAAAGTDYIHVQENEVKYFELLVNPGDKKQYINVKPSKFRVGDIVEAQISFVAFPMRGGQSRLKLVLRALTLLDGSYTKSASIARIKAENRSSSKAVDTLKDTLKRKVGYSEEDENVKETRKQFKNLAVSDSQEEAMQQ